MRLLHLILFFGLTSIVFSQFTRETDSLALVAIYNSTTGANWNSPWDLNSSMNTWNGVTLSGNRVISLSLYSRNLNGTLPAEIGNLSELTSLHIRYNYTYLYGEIPTSIGNLTQLTQLYVTNNALTGALPDEIGNLVNLQYLALDWNKLSGSIPASIGNLTGLLILSIPNNQFSGELPSSLANLTALQTLNLESNRFNSNYPTPINSLINLNYLNLANNQFTGNIPTEIGNLTLLNYLYLNTNQLSGTLPYSIANMRNLNTLNIQSNQIDSLPDFRNTPLDSASSFYNFYVQYNILQFNDIIPNLNVNINTLGYTPQYPIDNSEQFVADIGDTLIFTAKDDEIGNSYSWYKDNNPISGANGRTDTVVVSSESDQGVYTYRITNSNTGTFTLSSNGKSLAVTNSTPPGNPYYFYASERPNGAYLTWYYSNEKEADFHKYYFYADENSEPTTLVDSADFNTQYSNFKTLTGLTNGVRYYIRLRAKDVFGNFGNWSNTIAVIPDSIPPAAPSNLNVFTDDRKITLTWTPPLNSDILKYYIYRSTSPNPSILTDSTDGAVSSRTYTSLTNGQTYYFKIKTVDRAYNISEFSDEVNGTPTDRAPYAINDLRVIAGNASATLNWTGSTDNDINRYLIYLDTLSPAETLKDSTYSIASNLSSLINGQTYYATVKIRDNAGNLSDFSNEVSFTPTAMDMRQSDSLALVTIYHALNGGTWSSGNWDLSQSMSTWSGVTFNNNRVSGLYLQNRAVTGYLPSAIGKLSALQALYLYNNAISGSIPDSLSECRYLTIIYMSNNQFSGPIPASIGSINALTQLYLSNNQLTSLPPELFNLTNLQYVELTNNLLTGTISDIINLEKLAQFNASYNQLSGELPNELGSLKNLSSFYIQNNKFSGALPASIVNLSSLSQLDLSYNQFSGAIQFEWNKLSIYSLNLRNNQFEDSVPKSIFFISNLNQLYLDNNKFFGRLPNELKDSKLSYFYINNNRIDSLPDLSGSIFDSNNYYFYSQSNKLTFNDIVPNIGVANYGYSYAPQDSVDSEELFILNAGDSITLHSIEDLPSNSIQWYKQGSLLSSETSDTLKIRDVTEVDAGKYHYYLKNSAANSLTLMSRYKKVAVVNSVPPAIPSALTASARNSAVLLNWTKNDDADFDKFYIYMGTDTSSLILIDSTGSNSFLKTALTNDSTYYFRLKAKDIFNNISVYSLSVSAVPDGTAPSTVDSLFATAGERQIMLKWNASSSNDVGKYYIYRSTTPNPTVIIDSTNTLNRTYTYLSNGVTYYFRIKVKDKAGNWSGFSMETSATPVDLVPPAITSLSVIENNGFASANWANISMLDFSRFVFFLDTLANPSIGTDSVYSFTTVRSLNNLVNGKTYFLRMKTVDQTGNRSDYSNEVSFVPGNYRMTDSLALVAFYNATGGASWNNPWNLTEPITNNATTGWNGVTVSNGRVTSINLNSRNLSGSLPSAIGRLTALQSLAIYYATNLSGALPDSLFLLKNLSSLTIFSTNNSGSLPSSLGNALKLGYLQLNYTQISGEVPAGISSLTNLNSLSLYNNYFNGEILNKLTALTKLTTLYLYNNQFSGEMPAEIGNLSVLSNFRIENNQFSGSIPDEIGNLTSLYYLYLNNNQFSGSLPASIGNLTSLYYLYLQNNQLSGSLPSELSQLSNLYQLVLNNNQFSGSIDFNWASMVNLQILNLSYNQLSGSLPINANQAPALSSVFFNNNQFSGMVPVTYGNADWQRLELSYNDLDSVPNFSGTTLDANNQHFFIDNNRLTFNDIIPNYGVSYNSNSSSYYRISPQDSLGTAQNHILAEGDSLVLTAIDDYENVAYQWYFNNNSISGATSKSYVIRNANSSNIGRYNYRMTHPTTGNSLTLHSRYQKLLIPDTIGPLPPTTFTVLKRNESAELSWTANSEIDFNFYRLYRAVGNGAFTIFDDTLTNNALTVSGLSNGQLYRFYIESVDIWGNVGNASAVKSVTPDGTAPNPPTLLSLTAEENAIRVNWSHSNSNDVLYYEIYRDGNSPAVTFRLQTTDTTYRMTGLKNDTTYFFRIAAMDSALNRSAFSNELSSSPIDTIPPAPVVLSTVDYNSYAIIYHQSSSIPDFSKFVYYVDTVANPTQGWDSTTSSGTTSRQISNLVNSKTYYFRMRQKDITGNWSDYSPTWILKPNNYRSLDSLALIAVYDSLNGSGWSIQWTTSNSMNTWHGVTVQNNRVNQLRLEGNNLSGTIPNEITNLTALEYLYLNSNPNISGHIPDSIGKLKNLYYLYLHSNTGMRGGLPESIGQLKRLYRLYLYSSGFDGTLPNSLAGLSNLYRLYLNSNNFTGALPADIWELPNLNRLQLYDNQFSGDLPEITKDNDKLMTVYLQNNAFTKLPQNIQKLKELRQIYVSSNQLSGSIPAGFGQLTYLNNFDLSFNQLTGSLPDLSGSPALNTVSVNNNLISELHAGTRNSNSIEYLYIHYNKLREIPDFKNTNIDNVLYYLYVQYNHLDFGQLEKNLGVAPNYNYSGQTPFDNSDISIPATIGASISLRYPVAGTNNVYNWYKEGSFIHADSVYTINSVDSTSFARYQLRVTNSLLPSLTYWSPNIYVELYKKPDLALAIHQNPASTNIAGIYAISDLILASGFPKISVIKGTDSTHLVVQQTDTYIYKTDYVFTSAGPHKIYARAMASNGLDSVTIKNLNVVLAKANETTLLSNINQSAKMMMNGKGMTKDRLMIIEEFTENGASIYKFGSKMQLQEKSLLEIVFDKTKISQPEKLFIAYREGDNWITIKSKVYLKDEKITANVSQTGAFKLVVDLNYLGNNLIPDDYALMQNYPNPFNPTTVIPFALKENTKVSLTLYNILGQKIKTLLNKADFEAGLHQMEWDGTNNVGIKVASGVYFYILQTPQYTKTLKMVLIK